MPIRVNIPSPLRRHTAGTATIEVEGTTVSELLNNLFATFPDLRKTFFPAADSRNQNILLYVNDEDIRFLQDLATPINSKDHFTIIPGLSGG